jgi:Tfp pilus assembly protein PilF
MISWRPPHVSGRIRSHILVIAGFLICAGTAAAQAGDICREFGEFPNRDLGDNGRLASFVFGRIVLLVADPNTDRPQMTALYTDTGQPGARQRVGRSGNYCFRRFGSGGTVVIEVNGLEVARRAIPEGSGIQQREDFEIDLARRSKTSPPGVVSVRQPNPKSVELYKQAVAFEQDGRTDKAIETVNEIVRIDPEDAVAWTKLGTLYQSLNNALEAEKAFNRALAVRKDYVPALMNLGILKAVNREFPAAVKLFHNATVADPSNARAFRLLGEAYLHDRKGTLGLEALDKALAIDPVGMADAHLLKARLFELAGAKKQAAEEYREFLKKVPKYKEKKILEAYIDENGR